ncbi:uncharacterized protein ISCGN_003385 [Ixodes scapularis]
MKYLNFFSFVLQFLSELGRGSQPDRQHDDNFAAFQVPVSVPPVDTCTPAAVSSSDVNCPCIEGLNRSPTSSTASTPPVPPIRGNFDALLAGDLRGQRCQQEHRRRRTTCVSSPSPLQPYLEWYKPLPSLTKGRILVRQDPPKRRGVDPLRPLKPSCLEVEEFPLAPLKAPGNSRYHYEIYREVVADSSMAPTDVLSYAIPPQFDEAVDKWPAYQIRLEAFFEGNGVIDVKKKRALLVAVLSANTVDVISGRCALSKVNELPYSEVVDLLQQHFSPRLNETAQSYKLFSRNQLPGEPVIEGVVGKDFHAKKMSSGDLLIQINTKQQSDALLALNSISDNRVTVTAHRTLNTVQGVIFEDDLLDTPEKEVVEVLATQGVTAARRITLRRDGVELKTKHIVLTFESTSLPEVVRAGYLQCRVRPYVPNSLRCFKCQRFGHGSRSCRGTNKCAKCSSKEDVAEAYVFGRPASPVRSPFLGSSASCTASKPQGGCSLISVHLGSGAHATASKPQGGCCCVSTHLRAGYDLPCPTCCFGSSVPGHPISDLCFSEEAWGAPQAVDLVRST